uniref:Ig-like domain-containing protein n=1 Tax=Gasterosteus aculeatus aculeatus TaxID=481459 RepID=A0AAQ4R7H5_GASAC
MWSSVMKNQQTLNLLPVLGGSMSLQPVLSGPDAAFLSSRVTFRCIRPDSSLPVTYELIRDGSALIAVVADLPGDQKALFHLKVTATSEGSYHCKATTPESTGVSNSIRLSVVTPASNTRVTSDPFPPAAYEGSRMALSCSVAKGSHLFYTWLFNRKEVTSLTSPPVLLTGNELVMGKVAPEHAGYYSCMAWSEVQGDRRFSSSQEVQMTVKAYLSKPRISYSIFKQGASRYGNVTCWSTRGSPPVNISLSVNDKEVGSVTGAQSLVAWFLVAMAPRQDTAVARCRVKTEVQELTSEPVTLEMVPVGGHVKVEVEYLYSADSKLVAAKLTCQVSRGTFPHISWLLNNSSLPSETHEDSLTHPVPYHGALADRRRTLFLAKLGPEESGYYVCRARDSYNDSGAWLESAAVLVGVTEVFLNTIEVLTIVFCCFLFLMLAVGAGCVYKMFDHKHAQAQVATTDSDAFPLSAHTSPSGGRQDDTLSKDFDFESEITV